MREIAEADLVGDRADGAIREPWIAQQTTRARETLVEQELRERGSIALEQYLHVTRSDAVTCREASERQFGAVQVVEDF